MTTPASLDESATRQRLTIRRALAALVIIPTLTCASTFLSGYLLMHAEMFVSEGSGGWEGTWGALIGGFFGFVGGLTGSLLLVRHLRLTRTPWQLLAMTLTAPISGFLLFMAGVYLAVGVVYLIQG